jgi:hypothetical protein
VSKLANSAGNARWPRRGTLGVLAHNIPFYSDAVRNELGLMPALFAAAAVIWFLMSREKRGNALYLAWALAAFLEVWFLPPYDIRYLFFAYPALAVLSAAALLRISSGLLSPGLAWAPPVAAAVIWLILGHSVPSVVLRGPSEAAAAAVAAHPQRVVYCGRFNGLFIFAMRSLDPALRTAVIRGDKLPASDLLPARFEDFAHRYGVTHVVLERRPVSRKWDALYASPSPSMELLEELPMESNDPLLSGRLRLFRFKNPSPQPESTLTLKTLGGRLDADLE